MFIGWIWKNRKRLKEEYKKHKLDTAFVKLVVAEMDRQREGMARIEKEMSHRTDLNRNLTPTESLLTKMLSERWENAKKELENKQAPAFEVKIETGPVEVGGLDPLYNLKPTLAGKVYSDGNVIVRYHKEESANV